MNFFDNSNWRPLKFLLSCFGAWPFQSLRLRRITRTVVFILISSIIIPEIIRLIIVRKHMNLIVESIPIFALHLLAITKMLQCLFNIKKIRKLLVQIQKDWQSNLSSKEEKILQNYSRQTRIIAHTYIYFIYAITIMYTSTAMMPKILDYFVPLNESRSDIVLYPTEYFVDSEKYKIPILTHAYIITPFPSTVIVAFDGLYVNCVQHGCSMFEIVGYRIENITNKKKLWKRRGNWRIHNNVINHRALNKCIEKHKEILEYARLLESTYTTFMIPVLGINMLAMSITGLQTILKLDEPSEMMRFGIYTIGQVVHLFFLSWPSQKLMDNSEKILQSTFNSEWYTFPPEIRRYHIMIMMRGRKPCKLTAGNIYTMSLESFGQVVKTSMSYCAVLLSLQ